MRPLPTLGFAEAIKLGSSRIWDFKGRSRRSEFWWCMLLVLIANFLISQFLVFLPLVSVVVSIVIMFFGLAVTVRRLHDTGKSGWWVLISYALHTGYSYYVITSPLITQLLVSSNMNKVIEKNMGELMMFSGLSFSTAIVALLVIIFCLLDSTPSPNQYGESPKYVAE